MTYEVLEGKVAVATFDTMAEAISVVRDHIAAMAPDQAAGELAIIRRDARGRVRRRVERRHLVALALGVGGSDPFRLDNRWDAVEDAVGAGWNVELELVPEGCSNGRGRWTLTARLERALDDGTVVRESAVLWWSTTRREAEDAMRRAQ